MDNGASSYRRFIDGDDEGIAEIVREYKDGLIMYINGLCKNVHTAEEIAEDTFFKLITKKPKFSGKSSFRSWLYAIGRNTAVDHIRRSRAVVAVADEDLEQYAKDGTDLEKSYIKEETKLVLHRSLEKLPPEYRQALWLSYFEDFSNKEAAVAMNKSERQIRNLLYRANLSLKAELEKEGYTNEDFG